MISTYLALPSYVMFSCYAGAVTRGMGHQSRTSSQNRMQQCLAISRHVYIKGGSHGERLRKSFSVAKCDRTYMGTHDMVLPKPSSRVNHFDAFYVWTKALMRVKKVKFIETTLSQATSFEAVVCWIMEEYVLKKVHYSTVSVKRNTRAF